MTISLDKRIETATISLRKMADNATMDLGNVGAQVSVHVDYSVSAAPFYRPSSDGVSVAQESVERGLALSLTGLDDDGQVPVRLFHHGLVGGNKPTIVTKDNYAGIIDKLTAGERMGRTRYSQVIEECLKMGGRHEKDELPHFHQIYTDGAPDSSDKTAIEHLLVRSRNRPHFFQFIMWGSDSHAMKYLDHLNNLSGEGVDNVGVTIYSDPANVDDQKFFADIVDEFFTSWLPIARAEGITTK